MWVYREKIGELQDRVRMKLRPNLYPVRKIFHSDPGTDETSLLRKVEQRSVRWREVRGNYLYYST